MAELASVRVKSVDIRKNTRGEGGHLVNSDAKLHESWGANRIRYSGSPSSKR
jgi:hypothetical protein